MGNVAAFVLTNACVLGTMPTFIWQFPNSPTPSTCRMVVKDRKHVVQASVWGAYMSMFNFPARRPSLGFVLRRMFVSMQEHSWVIVFCVLRCCSLPTFDDWC